MSLKKIAAGAALVGALGFGAVGLSAGTANAAPPAPVAGWAQDHDGYWDHNGDDRWGHRADWDDRGWDNGPRWGCFTGPFGHISWCP